MEILSKMEESINLKERLSSMYLIKIHLTKKMGMELMLWVQF